MFRNESERIRVLLLTAEALLGKATFPPALRWADVMLDCKKAAQQSVQRIAIGAFLAGVLVGVVVTLVVVFVQIGVR